MNVGLLKVIDVVLSIAGFNINTDVATAPKTELLLFKPVTPMCPTEHIENDADVAPIDDETQFQ